MYDCTPYVNLLHYVLTIVLLLGVKKNPQLGFCVSKKFRPELRGAVLWVYVSANQHDVELVSVRYDQVNQIFVGTTPLSCI